MKRYDAAVRLSGKTHHEVAKAGLSAAEITILRTLHGDDAVVRIRERTNDKSPHGEERAKLHQRYGLALSRLNPPTSMNVLFGPEHVKLPIGLSDAPEPAEDEADEVAA